MEMIRVPGIKRTRQWLSSVPYPGLPAEQADEVLEYVVYGLHEQDWTPQGIAEVMGKAIEELERETEALSADAVWRYGGHLVAKLVERTSVPTQDKANDHWRQILRTSGRGHLS